jgi:flagellar biosynthesis protein
MPEPPLRAGGDSAIVRPVSRSLVPTDPKTRRPGQSETPAKPAALPGPLGVDMVDAPVRPALPARRRRQAAVALKHGLGQEAAPRVVAKGYGEIAEKILKLAFANDVRVRHDPDLVEVLAAVEVDCQIPIEAFAAVAEILSYVYEANGQLPPSPKGPGEDRR